MTTGRAGSGFDTEMNRARPLTEIVTELSEGEV